MDQPAYQRIAADIRRRIHSGEWQPGHPLPSWRWLANRYGVGFSTVERAIRQLRAEWLVEGVQRAQLWVAYPPAVRTLINPDATWPYGVGDTETGVRRADPELLERLRIPGGSVRFERKELLDPGGRPAMLLTTWRPTKLGKSPHVAVHCEVLPHLMSREEALLLGLATGAAALLVQRTRLGVAGQPVEVADLVLPADRWRVGW